MNSIDDCEDINADVHIKNLKVYAKMLESEAEQLRMSWHNAEKREERQAFLQQYGRRGQYLRLAEAVREACYKSCRCWGVKGLQHIDLSKIVDEAQLREKQS